MGGRRGRLYRVDLHYERSICITMGRVNIVLHTPFCEGAGQIIYVCVVSYIKSLDVGRTPPYPHGGGERISPIDMSFGRRGGGGREVFSSVAPC